MKELNKKELMSLDGGHVPASFYMDNDVIRANTAGAKIVLPVYQKVTEAFVYEILKLLFGV